MGKPDSDCANAVVLSMAQAHHDGLLTSSSPSARPRPPSDQASKSFLSTLDLVRTTLSRTPDEAALRDNAWPNILKRIHGALDTGKPITGAGPGRGLPMDVVVQTLKASWHVDDTWPIGPNALKELEDQSKERMREEKGPEAKQDPSPQDVARAYSARGIHVKEIETAQDDW